MRSSVSNDRMFGKEHKTKHEANDYKINRFEIP